MIAVILLIANMACHYSVAADWYWQVRDHPAQIYSTAANNYIMPDDATYRAWLGKGCKPTGIDNEVFLNDVLLHARPKAAMKRQFSVGEIVRTLLVLAPAMTRSALGADADAPQNIAANDSRLAGLLRDLNFSVGTMVKGN